MVANKFLLVQLGRIGDLILMTPMFEILKKANPENQVCILAGRNNYQLAKRHPLIDGIFVYKKNLFRLIKLIQYLNQENFDYWIDPKDHFSKESYYFAKFSNAKTKIGFNHQAMPVFDISTPSNTEQYHLHALDRNLNVLRLLNFNLENRLHRPVLFIENEADEKFNNFLAAHKIVDQYLCVNISAKTKNRYWEKENWKKFLGYLSDENWKSIVISAPTDFDLAKEIINGNNALYYKTESIVDVFPVVKNAFLVITPDTAIVHIAAAFDKPLLGLYENYEPNYLKFSPLSSMNRMVMDPAPGAKLSQISVELLIGNFLYLLDDIKHNLSGT